VGSGPPLLCHPGGPGFSAGYFGALPELAGRRTLLLLDPRGTGASSRPVEPSGYDLEDYAADIEAVREHLAVERLDVLGHSHGGFVSIVWAGSYPHRVGRLVLAHTAPRFTDTIRRRRNARLELHRGRPYFEDALAALEDQAAGRYATDDQIGALYARGAVLRAPPDASVEPIVDALSAAGPPAAAALKYFNERIAASMDLRPQLAAIRAPTLVLAGEEDPFCGRETAEEIAAALGNPTLAVLPGADHFPFLMPEQRPSWSRAVLDFLQPLAGSERA
jgi:pimeloyl-ACP methyl ester carboxylesterase